MLQSGSNQQHNKRGTWTEAHNFLLPGHADPCEGKARASDWTALCNPALTLKEPRALVIQIVTRWTTSTETSDSCPGLPIWMVRGLTEDSRSLPSSEL